MVSISVGTSKPASRLWLSYLFVTGSVHAEGPLIKVIFFLEGSAVLYHDSEKARSSF